MSSITTTNVYSVLEWKSKRLLNEIIKLSTASDDGIAPGLNFIENAKMITIRKNLLETR